MKYPLPQAMTSHYKTPQMSQKLRHTPPYSQQFRYEITQDYAGFSLIDFYNDRFSFRSHDYWVELIQNGDISVNRQGVDPDYVLQENDVVITRRRDVQEPDVNADFSFLFNSHGVMVINKPAPLPVHPAGRYYKNSLTYILKEQAQSEDHDQQVPTFHTIHRLDCWTTGVLVLATEKERARFLHKQVEKQKMKKTYGVLACGDFGEREFSVKAAVGRVDGAHRGTGPHITEAKESETLFTPLVKKGDVTFLKAIPLTGRTNQIRVHVQAAGGHVLNDPLYSPGGSEQIDFMGLHCREMSFRLFPDEDPVSFKAPWPESFLNYFSEDELNRI